jgi:hypothetical protein
MARELVAVTLDIPLSAAHVVITSEQAGSVDIAGRVRDLAAERIEPAAKERQVRDAQARLAKELADQRVPVRDIGEALGVSFQRAQQILAPAATAPPNAPVATSRPRRPRVA